MADKHGSILSGSLLVAGTAIGAGMLALPVATAEVGFGPSLLVYLVCWAFMVCTGLLLLEACLWLKEDTNVVSIAGHTLGKGGSAFAWIWYLFLFYCLTLAYVVGGANFLREVLNNQISDRTSAILFVIVFGSIVYAGAKVVSRLNNLLIAGLALTYLAFVILGAGNIKMELLQRHDWSRTWNVLPIVFVAFAYQGLVPTLTRYMGFNRKRTATAILIGSFAALVTYIIWQGLILGIVPLTGPGGLAEARAAGESAVPPLKTFIDAPYVYHLGQFFAFFALTTSFLGVTLGLLDFLADGLSIKKTAGGKFILCLMIFIPPLILAEIYPTVFLSALDLAGGYGVALLLGLLPILMVWAGRYYHGFKGVRILPGGRWMLALLILFVVLEVAVEVSHTLGY